MRNRIIFFTLLAIAAPATANVVAHLKPNVLCELNLGPHPMHAALAQKMRTQGLDPSRVIGSVRERQMRGTNSPEWVLLKVLYEGRSLGSVIAEPIAEDESCWRILAVGVEPEVRGRGLGTFMHLAMAAYLRDRFSVDLTARGLAMNHDFWMKLGERGYAHWTEYASTGLKFRTDARAVRDFAAGLERRFRVSP